MKDLLFESMHLPIFGTEKSEGKTEKKRGRENICFIRYLLNKTFTLK